VTTKIKKRIACNDGYGIKAGYSSGTYHNQAALLPSDKMDVFERRNFGIEDSDDPICGTVGDVAAAAIIRWHVLKHLLNSNDVALACFAAGIIGANRLLNSGWFWTHDRGWVPNPNMPVSYRSWPSAVVKCAGAHLHRLTNRGADDTPDLTYSQHNKPYVMIWACLHEFAASTLSDDGGLRYKDVSRLKRMGILAKPKPSEWDNLCDVLSFYSRNGFTGRPECRAAYRQSSGDKGVQALAPARTLALLNYACQVAPCAAAQIVGAKREDIRHDIHVFSEERRRYALWASGNTPYLNQQMQMFDLLVAATFDRCAHHRWQDPDGGGPNGPRLYASVYDQIATQRLSTQMDGQVVQMELPPWAATSTLKTGEIVVRKAGIFTE